MMNRKQTQHHKDQAFHHSQMAVVHAAIALVQNEEELESGSTEEGSVEDYWEDLNDATVRYMRLAGYPLPSSYGGCSCK